VKGKLEMNTNTARRKSAWWQILIGTIIVSLLTVYIVPHGGDEASAAIVKGKVGNMVCSYLPAGAGGKIYTHPHHTSKNGTMVRYAINYSGTLYYGYCIKANADLGDTYTSDDVGSPGWTRLSAAKRNMMSKVLFYGWQNGKAAPYGNTYDYYMGTQVLLWDIEQGYRTTLNVAAPSNTANYKYISGTNAGKCYLDILTEIRDYGKGASFTNSTSADAKVYKMKHSYGSGNSNVWSLTLTDTNKLYRMKLDTAGSGNTVTVPKSPSWDYTVKRTTATNKSTIKFTSAASSGSSQPLLIWTSGGNQPIALGAPTTDDTAFYAAVATEDPGTGKINKTVTDGKSTAGFKFTITGKSGTATAGYSNTATTDANGEISLTLYPGTYTVTEDMVTAKAKGYELVTPAQSQTLTVAEGGTSQVNFSNDLNKGNGRIVKLVTDGGSLAGFKFTIAGKAGTATAGYSNTVITPATGIIEESLTPGVYTVTEDIATANAKGYVTVSPQQSQTLTVVKNEIATVTFTNESPENPLLNITKITDDGGPVSGFTFNVYRFVAAGTHITEASIISGANVTGADEGTISVNNDDIDAINKAIDNAETGTYPVHITANVSTEVDVTPEPTEEEPDPEQVLETSTETIIKTITVFLRTTGDTETTSVTPDTEGELTAHSFDYPYSTKIYNENFVTNSGGKITIELGEDDYGTYTVTEVMTSAQEARYRQPAAQTKTVSKDGATSAIFTFTNISRKGDLRIVKASEDGLIEGISFLVEGMEKDGRDTTDIAPLIGVTTEEGVIADETKGLVPGFYTVTEMPIDEVAEDYYAPQEPKIVEIKDGETSEVSFYNDVYRGGLKIVKTSEDGRVEDIDFLIEGMDFGGIDVSDVPPIMATTDAEGIIADEIAGLVPGFYTITEQSIEDVPENYYIPQEPQIIEIKNNEVAEVSFYNKIAPDSVLISKQSATTGEELPGAEITLFDKDGNEIEKWTSEEQPHEIGGLKYGEKYVLHEDTAPLGYELAQDIEFVLGDSEKVTMVDDPTSVFIEKRDKITKQILTGCEIQIIDDETDEVVTTVTSAEELVSVNLLSGKKYRLHEVKAPEGYKLAEKDVEFTASEGSIATIYDDPEGELTLAVNDNTAKTLFGIPRTGDTFPLPLMLGLLAVGGGITVVLLYFRHRQKPHY
jgi:hypothetical protein